MTPSPVGLNRKADVLAKPVFSMIAEHLAQESVPPLPPKPPGRSKLRKWTCGCTNIRVGVAELHARCTNVGCENPFRPA